VSWRERKKAATRDALQGHALRLFAEQGYDATTVDQIAAAAGVSHMTFFRYFPTKEDVVAADDYDPLLEELIRSRPRDESPIDRVHAGVRAGLAQVYWAHREVILARTLLMAHTPALRARMSRDGQTTQLLLERALSDGAEPTLATKVIAAACLATMTTAILAWADSDGAGEMPDLIDEAFAALRDATGHPLHRRPPPATSPTDSHQAPRP
jgi:AcrR family transcriptional regulator